MAAQSGPTETSAICPLSGESDIAQRSCAIRAFSFRLNALLSENPIPSVESLRAHEHEIAQAGRIWQ
jgi:hypothetical protein